MPRDGDTREAILRTAGRLIMTRGYNGFSYAHIAELLGVRTAAVHYHFKSKEDLGVAVGERFKERWRKFRGACASGGPLARLEAVFDMYAHLAAKGRCCPAASIHAEMDAVPESVAQTAREVVEELVDWLEAALEEGREQGKLSFVGEPRALAYVLISQAQGALQLGRSQGPAVFEATRTQVFRQLFGHTQISRESSG